MSMLDKREIRKEKLKNSLRKAFSLKGDTSDYTIIEERILSAGEVKGSNLCILVLAALIACIGLNMNSTAVIIGAMLISPLMGGIMAIAYGLATSDLKQARNSAMGLMIQVIACLVIAIVYFSISPMKVVTSELLARTSPTIWDVMIACFGGLAGIIGTTRKEKSNVIPGVAIATALMPPLCTAGFGIASGNLSYFLGAFYLFIINAYFICLSSVVVLLLIDIPRRSNEFNKINLKKLKRRILRNTIILIIPSIFFGYQMVKQEVENENKSISIEVADTVDFEKLTKELRVISPSIKNIELVKTIGYKEKLGQIQNNKIIISSETQLSEKEKKSVRALIEINIGNLEIEWKSTLLDK